MAGPSFNGCFVPISRFTCSHFSSRSIGINDAELYCYFYGPSSSGSAQLSMVSALAGIGLPSLTVGDN